MIRFEDEMSHLGKGRHFFMPLNLAIDKSKYLEYCSPNEYLRYMYGDLEGYIFRCQKKIIDGEERFLSECYQSAKLSKQKFTNELNTYASMNSFYYSSDAKKPERKVCCLKRLNALYVDIDCYKEGMRNDIVLRDLENSVFGQELPYPTCAIDSGRGLYLIWKFKKSEDKRALPRWERVQTYLIHSLARYGADAACKDAARVFRVPGSINTKSLTQVKVLRDYENEYSLYEIMKYIGIDYSFVKQQQQKEPRKATEKQITYATILASKAGVELPDFGSRNDTYKFIERYQDVAPYIKATNNISYFDKESPKILLKGYLADLHTLFSMRNKADCKREIALFLCRYWNFELYRNEDLALSETLALNASFAFPFDERYVVQNTKSAIKQIERGSKYNYKKSTLIDLLEITNDEMAKLRYLTIKTADAKKEEKKERNHHAYVMRLIRSGETTKKIKLEDRLADIRRLLSKGYPAEAITKELEISKATYYRMIAKLNSSELSDPNNSKSYQEEYVQMEILPELLPAPDENVEKQEPKISATTSSSGLKKMVFFLFSCAVSFFKLPFWKRALAPQGVWGYSVYIYIAIQCFLINSYPKGYERKDDCKGHDSA